LLLLPTRSPPRGLCGGGSATASMSLAAAGPRARAQHGPCAAARRPQHTNARGRAATHLFTRCVACCPARTHGRLAGTCAPSAIHHRAGACKGRRLRQARRGRGRIGSAPSLRGCFRPADLGSAVRCTTGG
jgi:hypothetical protein